MQKTFYEIKVWCLNEDEASLLLKPLNLGAPRITHVTDTYLKSNSPNTEKIYEVGNQVFYVVVEFTPMGFFMTKVEITPTEKADHLKKGVDKVMKKERQIWELQGLEIATDKVEGLKGTFLEVSGPSKELVSDFLIKLGIKESRFITKPYNKFAQRPS